MIILNNIFVKCRIVTLLLFVTVSFSFAQTISSPCGLNVNIPNNSCGGVPLEYAINVSVAGTQLGVDAAVASVSVVVAHPFDGDLTMELRSPNGVVVLLSSNNGSFGINYGDPLDTTCAGVTNFSRNGADGLITAGVAPFIGNFIPQGNLDVFNDSSDPNGIWKLIVCDNFGADSGTLEFVSIEFAQPCADPAINNISAATNSAVISWTSVNPGAAYTLEYGVPGFTPGGIGSLGSETGTAVAGNNSETITGLSAFSAYDFYLSENCGVFQSTALGPFSFTTNKTNAVCSVAIAVACGDVITDSTNAGATTANAPFICGTGHADAPGLWYVFTGNGMTITVSTCGFNGYDTRIGVFEGPCLDLTCVDGNEDFCAPQSSVTFVSTAGKEYYIYVSGNAGASGVFQLDINCSVNLVINEIDYTQSGIDSAEFIEIKNAGSTTVNLSTVDLLLVDGTAGGAALYNIISLPDANLAAGDYFVICGSSVHVPNCDFTLSIAEWLRDGSPDAVALSVAGNILDAVSYNGDAGAPYTETSGIGLDDDSTVVNTGIARIPDGTDTDVNNADFSQRCISPGVSNIAQSSACTIANDSCASAWVIEPALNIPFDNNGATTDGASDFCDSIATANDQIYSDLWYSFTPACNGTANFSTVGGTTYDTRVQIYLGSCAGAVVGCNDDSSGVITQSTITWAVTSGTTYILRLGGYSSSQQDTGTFDLTLAETTAPIILCGANKFKNTDPGTCSAVVNPAATTATDNCSAVTLINDYNLSDNALGAYPLGTTVIVWTATDASGNTASCTQNVTITDVENPQITCPSDYAQATDSGMCSALVTVSAPSVSDNCTLADTTNNYNITDNATDTYPVGTTTVIWTITDGSGNTATCSHTVTVTDQENPVLNCPADIVIPNCGSFTTVPVPANSDNCGIASFINDFNGTPDASGVYPVGVTQVEWTATDTAGNATTCSIIVTRNAPPSASITPAPAETCALTDLILFGNPTIGSSGIASRSWSGPLVGSANLDSAVVNFGLAGIFGPVIYTITDSNGCSAADSRTITVFPNPVAIVIPDVIEACAGDTVSLAGNFSGGTGPYSHEWTGDTALLNSVSTPTPDFAAPAGNYNLTYSVKDANGCSGSDAVLVIVNQNPSVSITPNPAQACLNTPLTLNANLISGSGAIIAQGWTGNTSKISSLTNPVVNFNTSSPGIFNVAFSVSDNNLCAATDSITVTVDTLPVVAFAGVQSAYCADADPDTLSGTPAGGSFSGPGISGLPATSAYVGGPDTTSDGLNVSAHPVSVPGNLLGVDVLLKKVCFSYNHPNVSDIDILLESPSGTQVLLVNSICGNNNDFDVCIERGMSNSIDLAACDSVSPALNGTFTASSGEDIDSLNDGSTNPNGIWNLLIVDNIPGNDGALVSWSLEFEYLGMHIFNPAEAGAGAHTITYAFTDGNGCSGSASQNITVNPVPVAAAGIDQIICNGDSAMLTAAGGISFTWSTGSTDASIIVAPTTNTTYYVTVTNASGCEAPDSVAVFVNALPAVTFSGLDINYCWDADADTLSGTPISGLFTGNGISSGVADLFDPVIAGAGTHTVYYAFTDSNGCTGVDSAATTVFAAPPAIAFPDTGICMGGSVMLTATGGTLYNWNTGASTDTITVTPVSDSTYTVNVTDTNGCRAADNVTVTVFSIPIIDAGTNTTVCSGTTTMLTATGGNDYMWNTGDSLATISITPTVPATYSVTGTDGNGCVAADTVDVDVHSLPTAVPGPDEEICIGDTVTITASGGDFYYWSDGTITSASGAHDVAPLATTNYTVIVEDSNNCTDTASLSVIVHTLPVAEISGLNAIYCSNDTPVTLTGTPAGGNFAGAGMSGSVFLPALLAPGDYEIAYIYMDSFGCADNDTADVTIMNAPAISFSGLAAEYCPDTVAHVLTGTPAGGTFSGSGISGSSNTFVSAYAGTGTHDIIYIYFATGVCPGRDTQSVVVHELPEARVLDLDSVYCSADEPDTITGFPAGGIFSGAAMTGSVFFPPAVLTGTPSVVYYEYADSNGCRDAANKTTMVYPNPAPLIVNPGSLCVNSGVMLLTGAPQGGVFTGAGITGNAFFAATAGAGNHPIQYTFTDNRGCAGDTSITVTVHDVGTVSFTGLNNAFCVNDPVALLTGTPSGGTYSGLGVSGNTFNPAGAGTGGPYDIVYAYTDSNNCTVRDTQSTSVLNAPFAQIGGLNSVYCVYETTVPINLFPTGGELTGAGLSGNNFSPNAAGVGTHVISYKVTNAEGCSEIATAIVTVDACVGVAQIASLASVNIYPNPSSGQFIVEINGRIEPQTQVRIYDMTGKVIYEERTVEVAQSYRREFDLTRFSKGVYFLRINFNSWVAVEKIVTE